MLNLKISLSLLVAVAAITVGSLVVTNGYISEMVEEDLKRDLALARETVMRSDALAVHGQLSIAAKVSAWPKFAEKLMLPYPEGIEGLDQRHQAIWEELNVWRALLEAKKKEEKGSFKLEDQRALVPDEMFVVDHRGAVVARFSDYAWWGNNIAKELPVVLEVGTSKTAERDMWSPPGGGMMEVTVGPILGSRPVPGTTFAEQLFLGSVILGYKMDDEEANRLRDLTKAEVCFFYAGKVSAGTLGVEQLKALQAQVIEQEDVRLRGRVSPDSIFDLAGRRYRAVAGLFSSQANSRTTAGFVLLLSSDDYLKPITVLNTYIPLAGAAIFLVMLVFTATIGRGFIRPFEVLDQGIHEIINGNQEYVFPTSRRESLAGNMGHSLNMLVCTLLGKPVPEDDDSPGPGLRPGAAEWKDPLFIDEAAQVRKRPEMVGLAGLGGGARKARGTDPSKSDNSGSNNLGDSTLAVSEVPVARVEPGRDTQELLVEAEDKYFKRLYDEYLAARSETGEGVKGVTLEKFMEKLRSSEQQIRDQLGCRMVRFRVQKKDGKTTLKPIPIE